MTYQPDVKKIDSFEVDGLLGVSNSLAYKVHEIEKHFHNRERWLGSALVPDGEDHIVDRMVGTVQPILLTAGNEDFGSWTQILGADDTPIDSGMVFFDAHRFLVTATSRTDPYIIQISAGESGDLATNIANGLYTEVPFMAASNNNDSGISGAMSFRIPVGTKAWARCSCIDQNGATINAYYGIHEYQG